MPRIPSISRGYPQTYFYDYQKWVTYLKEMFTIDWLLFNNTQL